MTLEKAKAAKDLLERLQNIEITKRELEKAHHQKNTDYIYNTSHELLNAVRRNYEEKLRDL